MIKKFHKIDENGYYIEPVILYPVIIDNKEYYFPEDIPDEYKNNKEEDEFVEDKYIFEDRNYEVDKEFLVDIPFPMGMHKPLWDGEKWISGMTDEEIEIMRQKTNEEYEKRVLLGPPRPDKLGKMLLDMDIHNMKHEIQSISIGRNIIDNDIDNITMQKENETLKEQNLLLGQELIEMDLRLLEISSQLNNKGEE